MLRAVRRRQLIIPARWSGEETAFATGHKTKVELAVRLTNAISDIESVISWSCKRRPTYDLSYCRRADGVCSMTARTLVSLVDQDSGGLQLKHVLGIFSRRWIFSRGAALKQ